MDAVSEVVTVPASSDTTTTVQESTNTFNVNQSNNNNTHTHANAQNISNNNSLTNKTTNSVIGSTNSNLSIGSSSHSISSNSSCSSSSTSSNSSGYGSSTTTPTNNYDLQQTTPTTTPIPTTPIATSEHIIPVATVAAVAPFYNESITTHNTEAQHVQHHDHHSQQQQQQQHHLLPTNHHQYSQNHLQTNLQQQHHQYLPRQQYYSPYDYQQTAPTHNLSGSNATPAVAPYNMIFPGPYEMSPSVVTPSYGATQYKSASSIGANTNYERSSVVKTNVAAPSYNQQQHQQQQQQQHQGEQQQSKPINQQTQHFTSFLGSSKQRSSSFISSSTNTNTSKPQAAATPFYANPTPFYDNFKHKMPLEYHDTYSSNPSPTTAVSYHQQQKFYAAAKSQLKEVSYGSPPTTGLNSKSLYGNSGNFFPGTTAGLNLSSAPYDKYMYSHNAATGYSTTGHLGTETPPEVSSYRKPVVANTMNSPSWPWGIDYASGNSRSIPPPASHIPTATVAPTHATHLAQNPSVLARDTYYMGHDKYAVKYDKYTTPSYQQSYVSPPANRHMWPNTPHASNLTSLNDRHLLATGPPTLSSHGLHTTSYFPNSSATNLNSRQSCCSQPYQPQSCYYPASHAVPPRLPHTQGPTGAPPSGVYLTAQQTLGQSPHLNALNTSCKYGGVLPDYGTGNKLKNSNDLYLNTHHYDNNPASHNFGYGSAHNSQPLYNTNAHHQSMTHGPPTAAPLLTNDPLGANPTSYTNDLSLTTSNFDNYHSHLDTHASQQPFSGIHNQEPPPTYGVAVAKRALLDYRKPIQPQPPPTIAEECYTTLTSRDHYTQQELLNTPETTTTFGDYESHQSNANQLATAVLTDTDRERHEENSKNLSLRDFIANWNDDEDEYQNNEEINFDQDTVIDEVLQTVPVEQEAAVPVAIAIEEVKVIKPTLEDVKTNETLDQSVKTVEDLTATLSDADANQYVNLPDIVIDIEKSNNVNNSITTPTTSPTPTALHEVNNTSLNLTDFDVEKELDELKLKKPAPQELTKDTNIMKEAKTVPTPQLSPCKNLSFEDLNLEPSNNKSVLNAVAARLTINHSTDLNEHYFKDIEGYESSSSRHSNESAFEKEYETFINKITSETGTNKSDKDISAADAKTEKEIDFEKNFQDFSKFYKCKRKLKEDELKTAVPDIQSKKKLKTSEAIEVNHSNFPQVYTKKSRNKRNKTRLHSPHKRKPRSAYYKIIHSIRRFSFYRKKRVRELMAELNEKHLPLIKRQSIKNYTHDISESLFNAKTLKALCITAINKEEFRQRLMLTLIQAEDNCSESEEKHICTDPSCETCEVIKSLMEAESFETTLMQQATENNDAANNPFASAIFCAETDNDGTITILEATPKTDDLNFLSEKPIVISNVQYAKENFPQTFNTKDLEKNVLHAADIVKIISPENVGLENYDEIPDTAILNLPAKHHSDIYLQPTSETEININSESFFLETDKLQSNTTDIDFPFGANSEILERKAFVANNTNIDRITTPEHVTNPSKESSSIFCELNKLGQSNDVESVFPNISYADESSNISAGKKFQNSKNFQSTFLEVNANSNKSSSSEIETKTPLRKGKPSATKHEDESDTEDSDSSGSDTDSSSSDTEDKSIGTKSNSNNESSDTDSESNTDTEDEAFNSDSVQSHHSEKITSNENSAGQERKKRFKPAIFIKYGNKRPKLSLTPESSKEKGRETPKQTNIRTNDSADSAREDEDIPNSPQRIVIRITKSSSPNDQSLRVENIFGKSATLPAEVDSQRENEKNKKSEEVSGTPKVSLSQEECVPEKSLELPSGSELEDNTNTEKTSVIISAPLKLILRRQDFSRKKATERSDLDSSFDSESENESETNEATLNLSPKQNDLMEETFFKLYTEREFKSDEITEVITTSGKLSPRIEAEASEKCDKNKDTESEMTSKTKEEGTIEDQMFDKPLELHCELNKTENISEQTYEVVSTSLKSLSKIENFAKIKSDADDLEDLISKNEPEKVNTLKLSPKPTISLEVNVVKKSIESLVNTERELSKNEDEISTSLELKPIQKDTAQSNFFQQVPISPSEYENIPEKQIEDHALNDKFQLKSNEITKMVSANEHSSEITAILSNELEANTKSKTNKKVLETSEFSPKDDHQTERGSEDDTAEEFEKKKTDDPKYHHHTESESERDVPEEITNKKNYVPKNDHYTESKSEYDGLEEIKKKKTDDPKDHHQTESESEDDASGSESEDDAPKEIENKTTNDTKNYHYTESESENDGPEDIKRRKADDHRTETQSEDDASGSESEDDAPTEIEKKKTNDPKDDHYTESESEDGAPEKIKKKNTHDPGNDHHTESESEDASKEIEIKNKKTDDPKDSHYTESESEDEEIEKKKTDDPKADHKTEKESEYNGPEDNETKKNVDPKDDDKKKSDDPKDDHYTESESEYDGPEEIKKQKTDNPKCDHQSESESEDDAPEEFEKEKTHYPKDDHYTESESDNDDPEESDDPKKCHQTESKSEDDTTEEKSALTSTKIYDLTSSESELEEEDEEESDIEISSQSDDQESILSISESSNDSEYDSDEILEPNKKLNNSNTIVISDDESMDTCNFKKQLPTKNKSFGKTFEKTLQLINSKVSQKSLAGMKKQFSNKEEQGLVTKDIKHSISPIIEQQVNDLKVLQKVKDKTDAVTFNYDSFEENTDSESDFDNANKQLPENTDISEQQSVNSDEKYFLEHTSSEEDFRDETDDGISDHTTQKEEKELKLPHQSFTNLKEREDDENLELSKSLEINKDIIETESPIENQSILESPDCETKNDVFQKSLNIIKESSNTLQEKCEALQKLPENVDQRQTKTAEPQQNLENFNHLLEVKEANSETLSQTIDANENDVLKKSEIKITEGLTTFQQKSETLQILSENIDQMENKTAKCISEARNENFMPLLRVEELSTETLSQRSDVTVSEVGSTRFMSENPKILEENKSLGADFDQARSEDIIVKDIKSSTIEDSTTTSEPKANISQDIIEETINQEDVVITEAVCKSPKPQNDVQEEDLTQPGRYVNTNENSNISEEAKVLEKNFDQIMTEDETMKSEEKIIFEDPKTPPAETCNPIAGKFIPADDVEEDVISINKDPKIIEDESLDSKTTIAQIPTEESDTNLKATLTDHNMVDSKEINETSELLPFTSHESSAAEGTICEPRIEEAEISNDARDLEKSIVEPITETMEISSEKFSENSNISVDDNDEPLGASDENNTAVDLTISEVISESETKKTDLKVRIHNKEIVEEKSNENKNSDQNAFPVLREKSSNSSPTDGANKIAEEKLETSVQLIPEKLNFLEEDRKEHLENISDHESFSDEYSITPTDGANNVLENLTKTPEEKAESSVQLIPEKLEFSKDDKIEYSEKIFDYKILPDEHSSIPIDGANKILETTAEEKAQTSVQLITENLEILEDDKVVHSENISDHKILSDEHSSTPSDGANKMVQPITKTAEEKAEKSVQLIPEKQKFFEDEKKEHSEIIFDHEVLSNEQNSTPTDGANKILETITKTAEEKAETSVQLIPEKLAILEDDKIVHSENISDHKILLDEHNIKESICQPISDEINEAEGKHSEENFSGSETEKRADTTEQLEDSKQTKNHVFEENFKSSQGLELTFEFSIIVAEANKEKVLEKIIEEEKFLSKDILSTDLADVVDKDDNVPISQENMNQNSGEVPNESNQIRSPAKSPEVIFEKSNSNEGKIENELRSKISKNLKEVQASEEQPVDKLENPYLAKDKIISDNTEISESSETKALNNNQIITKNDQLEGLKPQPDKNSEAKNQSEHSNLICNEISSQHAPIKDCSTSDDMSRDFYGFKNQSSFEDESGDFHGFEDLEEIARIRLEIENLNDDSTANDGFLNNPTLNEQLNKSPIASLAGSMSSEINELEALEKELSQHQPVRQVADEDKETEKDLPIRPIEKASSNDIEHIKQMLESDEEQQSDAENKIEKLAHLCKNNSIENSYNNNSKDILSSLISIIPKLSDLCRAALNSSLNSNSNLAQQHTETSTILVERELSVEEALAEMYRQAGVLLSDPEDIDNDMPSPRHNEAHDVLLINLQEILNSDNNDVYVLQCDMNENVLNVVQSTEGQETEEHQDNDADVNTERVNTVQIILDTQTPEPQIHIISSDSESEVIILSDDDSEFSYRPLSAAQERVTIPFINDESINGSDSVFDISTIHHEEIVPDNLDKFLQEEFYKYLHEKYVQRNISKYYHANRVLKKYKRRFIRTNRQFE